MNPSPKFATLKQVSKRMGLSPKQKEEACQAIVGFLLTEGHTEAAGAVAEATNVKAKSLDEKFMSLLEKKWTSVIRLQKKVLELETALEQAQGELKAPRSRAAGDPSLWIPRPPAR